MMKQKRIVSLLTATGVLLANVPLMPAIMPATVLTASADVDEAYLDAFNNGGYGFTRDFDEATGTLTITGEGEMYDEYQLAATPFYDISGLKKLIISDGITNISDFAFSQCKTLTEVTLPESITSIGTCGFGFCSALIDIVLPDSLTIIGQGAFDNCSALKTITIPNGVTSIGENAFNGCTALTSITIPESVTKIGANTFRSCTALTEITVPDSVTEIDASAFEDCDNVTIKCSAGSYAQSYARENNISYEASGADDPVTGTCGDSVTWELNPATGTLTVSGTGAMTDYNWNSPFSDLDFSRLVIADGVTSIGAYAFEDCTALSDVSIADSVTSIGERAFFNCRALSAVSIPESVTSLGVGAFQTCTGLTSVRLLGGITGIPESAFRQCHSLVSVTVPEGVTGIENRAFQECLSLSAVILPESVTEMGEDLFYSSNNVTVYGAKGSYAETYANENSIPFDTMKANGICGKSVIWVLNNSDTLRICGNGKMTDYDTAKPSPFEELEFDKAVIEKGVEYLGDRTFSDCGMTSVILPQGMTEIGAIAFFNCEALESVTIPADVTVISAGTFYGCYNLTIKGYAGTYAETFAEDSNIPFEALDYEMITGTCGDSLTWEYDPVFGILTISGEGAMADWDLSFGRPMPWYQYRSDIKKAVIEDGVTNIGSYAFASCQKMSDITIPESISAVGRFAFFGTAWLTARQAENPLVILSGIVVDGTACEGDIVIPEGTKSIAGYAFYNCEALTGVTVPDSVKSIGGYAFCECTGLTHINIPDGVTSIVEGMFSGCSVLTGITLPESVSSIEDNTFWHCLALDEVTVLNPDCVFPESSQAFGYRDDETWELVFDGVFRGYEGSTAQAYAEEHGYTFESLGNPPDPPADLVYQGLKYTVEDDEVIITGYTDDLPAVLEIPAEIDGKPVTGFAQFALAQCDKLKEVTLPDTITSSGMQTFWGCKNLEKVTLPSTLKGLYEASFAECTALKSVTIPDGCEIIGNLVFSGCTSLSEVNIPASVKRFEEPAFEKTPWLEVKRAENPLVVVNGILIDAQTAKGEVTVPEGVTEINPWSVMNNNTITKLTLPKSLEKLDSLYELSELTEVVFLNPNCEIPEEAATVCNGHEEDMTPYFNGTIRGYTGSTAETFAKKNGYKFESLEPAALKGDVDGNGAIELDDAQLALAAYTNQLAHKPSGLTAAQEQTADVSGDGEVTVDDAQAILQYYTETLAHKNPTWDKILNPNQA